MDIVLNTQFNNPRLPILERPGFTDSFDRPNGQGLGSTDDGKPWDYFGFAPWDIIDGNATGFGRSNNAVVDGAAADGTVTAIIASAASESADKRGGLTLRMIDRDNYLYLCPNTSNVLTLYGRVNGATAFSQAISGETLSDGDVVGARLAGPLVTVLLNGDVVATRNVPDLVNATRHGLYSHSACDTEWDSIEFVAD